MKIDLIAVNRLGRTSENAMTRDFCERASVQGRSLALGPVDLTEVEPRKSGKDAEGEVILAAAEGAYLIVCDERGKQYASRAFAERLGKLRDQGERRIAFVIGGADGTSDAVKAAARESVAFGPQTWPHALARVMLAEQVYRAVSILAGSPYHRD